MKYLAVEQIELFSIAVHNNPYFCINLKLNYFSLRTDCPRSVLVQV
jgi:hypothetical protein